MTITLRASEHGAVDMPAPIVTHGHDPFADLSEALKDELRSILGPLQAAGAPIEYDPVIPMTVGTAVEGRLFRVAVVSQGGVPSRVAVLGPGLHEWSKDDFLALLPDVSAPPIEIPALPAPRALARPQAEILEDMLVELRAIRQALGA